MQALYKISEWKDFSFLKGIFTKEGVTREGHNYENDLRSIKKPLHWEIQGIHSFISSKRNLGGSLLAAYN